MVFSDKDVSDLTSDDDFNSERFDKQRADAEDIRGSAEAIVRGAKASGESVDDFEASREVRDEFERELGSRFPDQSPEQLVKFFASKYDKLRADPVNGGTELLEFYEKNFVGSEKAREPEALKGPYGLTGVRMPDGTVRHVKEGSIEHAACLAAVQTARDKAWRAAHGFVAQRGYKLTHELGELLKHHRAAVVNPRYFAARAARVSGMPVTDEEQQQYQAQERLRASVTQEIAAARSDSANYPRYDELRPIMADIFRNARNDERLSLQAVYQRAAKVADEVAAFKAKHPDFPQVRGQIQKLLNEGKAKNLDDAYAQLKGKPKDRRAEDPSLRDDIRRAARGRL